MSSAICFARRPPKADDSRYWRNFRLLHFGLRSGKAPLVSKCLRCKRKYTLGCLAALLPGRAICRRLCAAFFTSVYPLTPILHLPSFSEEYDSFWTERAENDSTRCGLGPLATSKPNFIALIYSILFAAVMAMPSSEFQSDYGVSDDFAAKLYRNYQISLLLLGFPQTPSLYTLTAYIFAQSQLMREEEFMAESPIFISRVFRLALSMGLHRKSSHAALSQEDEEVRSKIWWHIIHLDVMTSASSGLSPLFIDEKMSNVRMVSTFEDMETERRGHTADRNSKPLREILRNQWLELSCTVDLRHIVAACRYQITKEIRRIIRAHLNGELRTTGAFQRALDGLNEVSAEVDSTVEKLLESAKQYDGMHRSLSRLAQTELSGEEFATTSSEISDQLWTLQPCVSSTAAY
jgi:hypothetical protein